MEKLKFFQCYTENPEVWSCEEDDLTFFSLLSFVMINWSTFFFVCDRVSSNPRVSSQRGIPEISCGGQNPSFPCGGSASHPSVMSRWLSRFNYPQPCLSTLSRGQTPLLIPQNRKEYTKRLPGVSQRTLDISITIIMSKTRISLEPYIVKMHWNHENVCIRTKIKFSSLPFSKWWNSIILYTSNVINIINTL